MSSSSVMATDKSLADILIEDLLLEKWQMEERSGASLAPTLAGDYMEVDCLVHEEWLNAAVCPDVPLPRYVPTFSHEMTHWMLQASCATEPELPWKRVHICTYRKPNKIESAAQRYLVPRHDYSNKSIHTFLTTVSQESTLASWRNIAERLDNTNISSSTPAVSNVLTPEFMHQLVNELYNKDMRPIIVTDTTTVPVVTQKSSSPTSQEAFSISNDTILSGRETLSPLIVALESDSAYYLVYNYHRFTLFDCLIHSPSILESSTSRQMFILYQILHMVNYCHSKGVTLGDINLKNIYIDGRLWVQFYLPPSALVPFTGNQIQHDDKEREHSEMSTPTPSDMPTTEVVDHAHTATNEAVKGVWSGYVPPALSLSDAVIKWQRGELTNFDYIMILNYYAGRRCGDPNNHPIFPWIIDFSTKNGNVRDFTYSKHRLAKGDRQLDFTYQSAFEEVRRTTSIATNDIVPHHIGDIASDVTYYVYLARQTPKEVLCDRVRPRWVPEEYPSSITKLYNWTPDESIPEFYTDPKIFYSIHSDLPDLAVPDWCSSPEEFISMHRHLLESDNISSELHNWFDLVFGYKLSGDAAVKSKNVYLSLVDDHSHLSSNGIVQLFRSSHPKRMGYSSAPLVIFQWQHYLNMSSLSSLTSFDITQCRPSHFTPKDTDTKDGTLTSFLTQRSTSFTRHKTNSTLQDDGSFEHVQYPSGTSEVIYFNEDSFDIMTQNYRDATPSKFMESTVLSDTAAGNKQGLLRGILARGPRRLGTMETVDNFDWQSTNISIPQDTPPLQPLLQIEELSLFLAKSCRSFGSLTNKQWKSNELLMLQEDKEDTIPNQLLKLLENENKWNKASFEERAMLDVAAVTCIAVELTCNKYLRATLPLDSSLSTRFKILREILDNGQMHVPYHISNLIDQVFKSNDSSLVPSVLPNLSAAAVIQQFIPLISFPKYFEILYQTLSEFENRSKIAGLSTPLLKPKSDQKSSEDTSTANTKNSSVVITYIASQLEELLPQLDTGGLYLLMLYIFPLFEHPTSCFEAIFVLFDPLSEYLNKKWIQKVMIPSFLYAFDTYENPSDRCRLLGRTMAEKLIEKFRLSIFLSRFLTCVIDAVLEPLSKKSSSSKKLIALTDILSSTKQDARRRSSLSQLASSTLSPTRPVSLSYNWEECIYNELDEGDDSDPEADLSFPEASILATKVTTFFGGSTVPPESEYSPTEQDETSASNTVNSTPVKITVTSSIVPDTSPTLQPVAVTSLETTEVEDKCPAPSLTDPLDVSLVEEEDPLLPSSSEATQAHVPPSTPPNYLSTESFEEKECEVEDDSKKEVPTDPRELAISTRISEVASDCLIWLIWRLGPLLATKYIANPLLDSIHRCFAGVCEAINSSSTKNVMTILSSMIDYYGQDITLYLYMPYIKKQVAFLSKRTSISIKTEANVAASVALLEMSVNKTTSDEILLGFMEDIAHNYFNPVFQLLSSKTLPFPSGLKARVTICHSVVQLLKVICQRLGRVRSSEVVIDSLQYFFNCFSTAHNKSSNAILTPVEGYYDEGNDKKFPDISRGVVDENPIAADEVMKTFSPDMIHHAYVDFCKLIGQISLTNHLHNVDVIEELHASYSHEKDSNSLSNVSTLLGIIETNSSSDNSTSSDSTESMSNLDIAYQLGPGVALQGRRGLGPDSTSFGCSSWLVDEEDVDFGFGKPQNEKPVTGPVGMVTAALRQTLSVSTGPLQLRTEPSGSGQDIQVGSSGDMSRGSALFDAKFGTVTSPLVHDDISDNYIEMNSSQVDCKLKGVWSDTWQRRVEHGPNVYEIFNRFHGLKLQSYTGHRSTIKSLCVLDGEHMFLSGSKDRMVKIWSLHNHGDGNSQCVCKQTYTGHQRAITNVNVINSHQAVSCDGAVHLWDLQTSCNIHQFSSLRPTNQFSTMELLKDTPNTLIVSTADYYIRFIDTRMRKLQHLWKTHFPTGGNIRYLASTSNWIAVGSAIGSLNIIDIRTGQLMNHWKPADKWPFQTSTWGENLSQLKVTERGNILTSVGGGIISLWKPSGRVLNHFRGQNSSTPCLETYGEELVTISSNGQVLIHGSYEFLRDNVVCNTKIKPKELRGNVTCSAALQQNQLLLLGSETGQIVLMT